MFLQEIHLPDERLIILHAQHETDVSENFNDGHGMNTHVDNNDNILIESTSLETDCIDFGSRALHQEDVPKPDHYNAYDRTMPTAKEQVSLFDALKIPNVLVEEALDKIISTEKANMAFEKPPPRGTIVIWVSCWKKAQNICLVMEYLTCLSYKGDYLME
jgi:hypothetical protein